MHICFKPAFNDYCLDSIFTQCLQAQELLTTQRYIFLTPPDKWLLIPIYIQQDANSNTLYLHPETALHVSGGTSTHHQERIQLYLQHLALVTPLLLPAAIVEELELHDSSR